MNNDPEMRDGNDGWVLEDMDWDTETGVARFEYSRQGSTKVWISYREQPALPSHQGWHQRAPERVLELDAHTRKELRWLVPEKGEA